MITTMIMMAATMFLLHTVAGRPIMIVTRNVLGRAALRGNHIRDGLFVEHWNELNPLEVPQQLGAMSCEQRTDERGVLREC
jgi:hypothetical protein